MRLLRLSDVETSPSDHVFYYSRARAAVMVLMGLGAGAWLFFHAVTTGWKLGYYIAAVTVPFLGLVQRFITARFRPSNWLVRMNDLGMFIQFRSYLNYHLPAEDLTVVFVSYGEIPSARLVREKVTVPDMEGRSGTETHYLRYVELELAGDAAPLAKALEAEITEKAPMQKRWYGRSSTLYQDHPVRMQSPPFVQLRWQVVPRAQKFLDALRAHTTITDTVSISQDFAHLESLGREEQQQRLRELAQRGETITAIAMARNLYGCGLAEAKEMVEGLRTVNSAGASSSSSPYSPSK
jgi:ribosomal protein L7/L12